MLCTTSHFYLPDLYSTPIYLFQREKGSFHRIPFFQLSYRAFITVTGETRKWILLLSLMNQQHHGESFVFISHTLLLFSFVMHHKRSASVSRLLVGRRPVLALFTLSDFPLIDCCFSGFSRVLQWRNRSVHLPYKLSYPEFPHCICLKESVFSWHLNSQWKEKCLG